MANTVMTAKNTFAEGLVMDFAPDNTQATTLTSALNATLLTFNGNEMSLQNDMGNGRVETAYLPEGYIPVGTCEFGDIIYIVSYNPITNKSQIGCFPSPERNISSEEVSSLNVRVNPSDLASNGRIVTMSIKKDLFDKQLHAGDKFMIYTPEASQLTSNKDKLSDLGNTQHTHNYWPKLTKIHVISIEDSGKAVVLDSTVKWYDQNELKGKDYYINVSKENISGKDLDSYRNLVDSAWSIFQSKVTGKLALLIELEAITSFSCTHTVKTSKIDDENTRYDIYLNSSWGTDHNDINPSGIIITKSQWQKRMIDGIDYTGTYICQIDSNGQNIHTSVSIPIEAGTSDYGYDSSKVIEFSRLYDLANPSESYQQYVTNDSYNAKIGSIINQLLDVPVYNITLDSNSIGFSSQIKAYNQNKYYCNLAKIQKTGNLTEYFYIDKEGNKRLQESKTISDDVVNNYFYKDVRKAICSLQLKTQDGEYLSDLSNLIWNYTVAPVMPYGVLEQFSISNSIDFSKIGKGLIELTDWRYYNSGELSTFVLGLNVYQEEGYGISEVCLEFFDNHGKAAAYHINNKSSYSGEFTNYIQLNSKNRNHQLNNIGADQEEFKHPGSICENPSETDLSLLSTIDGKEVTEILPGVDYYYDDGGTIYPNFLYKVVITVKYSQVNELGQFSDDKSRYKYFSRWYWTTNMFNEQYFTTQDFNTLKPQLYLASSLQFEDLGISKKESTYHYTRIADNYLGATITHFNQNKEQNGNIRTTINIGLQQDYGIFNLLKSTNISGKLYLGHSKIENNYSGTIDVLNPIINENLDIPLAGYVLDKYGDESNDALGKEFYESIEVENPNASNKEIYLEDYYKNYKDSFSIEFVEQAQKETISYISLSGQEVEDTLQCLDINATNNQVLLSLAGIKFDKFTYSTETIHQYPEYRSILNRYGLSALELGYDSSSSHMFFKTVGFLGGGNKKRHDTHHIFTVGLTESNSVPLNNLQDIGRITFGNEPTRTNIQTNSRFVDKCRVFPNVIIPLYLVGYDDDGGNNWCDRIYAPNSIPSLQRNFYGSTSSSSTSFYGNQRPPGCKNTNYVGKQTNHISTLIFKYNSKPYIINDMFITAKDGGSQGYAGVYGIPSKTTMADLVANLYSNLYTYFDDIPTKVGQDIVQAISEETWNKEIITSIQVEDVNSVLLFHGVLFKDYIHDIQEDTEIDNSNISFDIVSETKCTNLSILLKGVQVQEEPLSDTVLVQQYDSTKFMPLLGSGKYFLVKNNELSPISNSSYIYCPTRWRVQDTSSGKQYFPDITGSNIQFKVPMLVTSLIECTESFVTFNGTALEDSVRINDIEWDYDEDNEVLTPFYNFSLIQNFTWNG